MKLQVEIDGSTAGLGEAISKSVGLIEGLQSKADKLKISFFKAETIGDLNTIGNSLTSVNTQIKAYVDAALKGGEAFKTDRAQAALDALDKKLGVITGNTDLFGSSIKSQEQAIGAYQAALNQLLSLGYTPADTKVQALKVNIDALTASINAQGASAAAYSELFKVYDTLDRKLVVITGNETLFGQSIKSQQQAVSANQAAINGLLSLGYDPADAKVQDLKKNVDALTASIQAQKDATAKTNLFAGFQNTGSLIQDAENKVNRLGTALRNATSERQIALYNVRLQEAQRELTRLQQVGQRNIAVTEAQATANRRAANSYNTVGVELGRVIQDAPYAANNFGAVANNITRLGEVFPAYVARIKETVIAQGQAATSANVFKASLAGIFTGVGGITIAISLLASAYTIYQQRQQAAARDAEAEAKNLEKQKNALNDYIQTLSASARVQASASEGYSKEIVLLDSLVAAVRRSRDARYGDTTALAELQKIYPEIFGNLKNNADLVNQLDSAYVKLRASIVATATVQAANSLAGKELENQVKSTIALGKANQTVDAAIKNRVAAQQKFNAVMAEGVSGDDFSAAQKQAIRDLADAEKAEKSAVDTRRGYKIQTDKSTIALREFYREADKAQKIINDNTPKKSGLIYDLEQQLTRLQAQQPTIKTKVELDVNVAEIKKVQKQLDDLRGKEDKTGRTGVKGPSVDPFIGYSQQLANLLQQGIGSAALSAERDFDKTVTAIDQKYSALINRITQLNEKVQANKRLPDSQKRTFANETVDATGQLDEARNTEILNARLEEVKRVNNEIIRIQNEFGVKAAEGRAKDLASIQAKYDAEITAAKGNAALLAEIEAGKVAANEAVRVKYAKEEQDLYFSIGQIQDKADSVTGRKEDDRTAKIHAEWEKRKKDAIDYYNALIKLAESDPALSQDQKTVKTQKLIKGRDALIGSLDNAEKVDIKLTLNKAFNDDLRRATESFTRDFYGSLTTLNQQTDKSFTNLFASVVSKFSTSINEIIFNQLLKRVFEDAVVSSKEKKTGDQIKEAGESFRKSAGQASDDQEEAAKKIAAGLALAGGLVSGATKKTSYTGQGIGGALSGAAAGTAIAPGIGTAIGALIGGIAGLFGAGKARKEERKLQEQQLEEARRQTELLRQNALAYTSSIVGRATENGIITNVDVNEFGKLVAKVSGKDLDFVLQRNKGR